MTKIMKKDGLGNVKLTRIIEIKENRGEQLITSIISLCQWMTKVCLQYIIKTFQVLQNTGNCGVQ